MGAQDRRRPRERDRPVRAQHDGGPCLSAEGPPLLVLRRGGLRPRHPEAKKLPDNECVWIWNSIQLNWDGTAVPCCRDPNGRFPLGNVFERGLKQVFNGEAATAFRARLLKDQGGISICRLCSGYGLPRLQHAKPAGFTIARHSINPPDLPSHEEAIANAQNTILARRDRAA